MTDFPGEHADVPGERDADHGGQPGRRVDREQAGEADGERQDPRQQIEAGHDHADGDQ